MLALNSSGKVGGVPLQSSGSVSAGRMEMNSQGGEYLDDRTARL